VQLNGLLFFPITPFVDGDGSGADTGTSAVDTRALATHISERMAHDPGAVFVACGTGEFHALSAEEHRQAVEVAVSTVDGRVPVIAGVGGALPAACANARAAAAAGADGVLVLPPYLVGGSQDGLVRYICTVAEAGGLPAIAYQRTQVRFTPEAAVELAAHPLLVGLKDGLGDLDLLQRILTAVRRTEGDDFMFFNGLPTAELTMKAYRGLGVELYSSAVLAFLPSVAVAFFDGLAKGDDELVDRLLADFYVPLVRLRDRVPGYAVSLVKAGVTARGLDAGPVRLPLVDPTPEDRAELERLITVGLDLVGT
jgi:5-dehydro-4-deoxyglucarate dehydratase